MFYLFQRPRLNLFLKHTFISKLIQILHEFLTFNLTQIIFLFFFIVSCITVVVLSDFRFLYIVALCEALCQLDILCWVLFFFFIVKHFYFKKVLHE